MVEPSLKYAIILRKHISLYKAHKVHFVKYTKIYLFFNFFLLRSEKRKLSVLTLEGSAQILDSGCPDLIPAVTSQLVPTTTR